MKFLLFILVLVFVDADDCLQYEEDKGVLDEFDCIARDVKDTTKVYVKECKDGRVCNIDYAKMTGTCEKYLPHKKYPGEYCDYMNECITGICDIEHRCRGGFEKSFCKTNSDCDYDFACQIDAQQTNSESIGVCVHVPKYGNDCLNGACDPPYICSNKKCVKFGSLPEGSESTDWRACSTFYVREGKCIPHYKLNGKDEDKPVPSDKCVYSYKLGNVEKTFEEEPVCGNNFKKYCNPVRHLVKIDNVISIFNL